MKNWFLNVAIFLLTTVLYAQSGVVTGEIIDGRAGKRYRARGFDRYGR